MQHSSCHLVWSWHHYSFSMSWAGITWVEPVPLQIYNWFEFRVCLLLDWFLYHIKTQSVLLFRGRIVGFIPLPRVLALCQMPTISFRIWILPTTISGMIWVPFKWVTKWFILFSKNYIFHSFTDQSYLPNPSAQAGCDTRSIFKRNLTGLNSEFSFS